MKKLLNLAKTLPRANNHLAIFAKNLLLGLIKIYQKTLSPDHGLVSYRFPYGACKYSPTCSEYAYQSINEHGVIKGGYLSTKRVLRCNPFSSGGHDPVPKK